MIKSTISVITSGFLTPSIKKPLSILTDGYLVTYPEIHIQDNGGSANKNNRKISKERLNLQQDDREVLLLIRAFFKTKR